MEIKYRAINSTEQYACDRKTTKNLFKSDDNIFISFGYLSKTFRFEAYSNDRTRPKINGIVVASASFNNRNQISNIENIETKADRKKYICFYSFKDENFDVEAKNNFEKEIFPELAKWYQEILELPRTSPSGVENLIIELDCEKFKIHQYRVR
ncbi:MAG: DUF616 domain-containing protein [Clostridiales bacterium]|nr:DUF616 domain-containing protein [Clostridiales bacterium]